MLIRNVTEQELFWALALANARFNNNLAFKSIKQAPGRTRAGKEKWNVVLTVRDCRKSGGRYYRDTNRHVKAACWHAHGTFYDALPHERNDNVEIVTSAGGNFNTTTKVKTHPGALWADWRMERSGGVEYASNCCHCGERGYF